MLHLLELGHRRIGFVYGVARGVHGLDRLSIYREVLQEAGLGVEAALEVHCGETLEEAYQAAHTLLVVRTDRPLCWSSTTCSPSR